MSDRNLGSELETFKRMLDQYSAAESSIQNSLSKTENTDETSIEGQLSKIDSLIAYVRQIIQEHDCSEDSDRYLLLSCRLLESRVLALEEAKERYFVQLSILGDLANLGIGSDKCNAILFRTQLDKLTASIHTFHGE